MEITIEQLERLLQEQKRITIEKLLGSTTYYNSENTDSVLKSLPIDKEKFIELGMKARFPDDIETLKRYNIK